MKLSYSKPFPKHVLGLLTKIWIFYILLSVGVVYGLTYFLQEYIKVTQTHARISQVQADIYNHEADRIKESIERTKKTIQTLQSRATYAVNAKDSIQGVLEIIPDSITISSITIDYSRLVFQGVVPSKEIFKNTIQQRLDSIFENSHVEFTPLGNGWYKFISTNSSDLPFIEKATN
ncbi:hypothetical protein [Helicobacter ailurogastricus]|uniref:Type IV pilus biogenesis protein PilN n=1 Tax=Helicobacter ailurogastricus TaxID=1578720 RepID=A0A0K2X380_9HELI|nr:hypothetical protein [Helicobacter ailurogastricus]CRF41385.1 hypothetical protein HAL011_11790 [Helicobacter ailurogastricus]CRF41998.1 hypothetical protein HAL013_01470 [Helicobacter ailurogastricus]CRF43636.1 hypothetical protein HAL09_01820 [Helicobacter ailurogastricus]